MGFFPDNLCIRKNEEPGLMSMISLSSDKVLRGYGGCHYIKRIGNIDLILDCRYRRNGTEEIEGLSSQMRSDSVSSFTISQYIVTNTKNSMHYFAKVSNEALDNGFPVAIVNGEILPSYIPGTEFSAAYEAFAMRSEVFAGRHEAELHVKHAPDYYGSLGMIDCAFYAPCGDNGTFRSLSVKSLLRVTSIEAVPVIYDFGSGCRDEAIAVAVCSSPLGGEFPVILSHADPKAIDSYKRASDLYLWADMVISADPAVGDMADGALYDDLSLISVLCSSMVFSNTERLERLLCSSVELFSGNEHIVGIDSVLRYLKESKGPLSPAREIYRPVVLDSDYDGLSAGHPAFRIGSYPEEKPAGLGFISTSGNLIDRIMFRY